jgi:uncharacterized protein with von Willebrand factor type A (vWA) domain
MQQLTVRVADETAEAIEERASDSDLSQSEAVRELLQLGTDYGRLQAEADDLRRQLQAVNRRESEHQELVEYVQEERSIQERREERRDAPIWRRAKWYVLGRSEGEA